MLRTVLGAAIAASTTAIGFVLAARAHAAADHVRYEIESNGPISLVTYFDGIGDIQAGLTIGLDDVLARVHQCRHLPVLQR